MLFDFKNNWASHIKSDDEIKVLNLSYRIFGQDFPSYANASDDCFFNKHQVIERNGKC